MHATHIFSNRQSALGRVDHGSSLLPIDQCTAPLLIMMTVTIGRALYGTSSVVVTNALIYVDR